jgi:hypothetical protein
MNLAFVCKGCKEGDHDNCANGRRADGTWCPCQHKENARTR